MSKEQYDKLYKGSGLGDTWSKPINVEGNPRRDIVKHARDSFLGPISVFDIGTGNGSNTKWIAETGDGSKWVGIDFVKHKDLKIPETNVSLSFYEGDFLNKDFRSNNPKLQERVDLIVDQAAILIELEKNELVDYLQLIYDRLNNGGKFVILLMKGESDKIIHLLDGRKRVLHEPEDLTKIPFSDYFEVDKESLENPMLFGYGYPPESDANPEIKNPIGAKEGDEFQIFLFQTILNKK
jgi:SAM-dependent methyltransferase